MMNWTDICPALVSVFTSIAVDDASGTWKAEWSDRHRDYISPEQGLALYLKVTSCVTIGEDEDRYDDDDSVTQTGLRRFILNVQADVAEDQDNRSALQTLERIRTRLRRRAVLDALLDVNVALVEVGNTQNVSATFDSRVWSIGSLDVTFCAAVNDTDPVPVGRIERVVMTSNVRGALSNLTNEETPPSP